MMIARSLRGVRCIGLNSPSKRSLSVSIAWAARPRLRPAPKKPPSSFVPRNSPVEEQLPPMALLKSAKKSDALDVDPDRALSILRDYIMMSGERKLGTWEKQFLIEKKITSRTLLLLALILSKCKEKPRRLLATNLLFSASAIGEPAATILLVNVALKEKNLENPQLTAPLSHLRKLTTPPHSRIEAMVLLGKTYESQGNKDAALQLYRQATSTSPNGQEGIGSVLPLTGEGVASAFVRIGNILEGEGKEAEAREAFRRAALDHDDPVGYYHLARMEIELSETQNGLLLKSAASGNLEAAIALWKMYRKRAHHATDTSVRATESELAKEWLYICATAGDQLSILTLARVLVDEGKKVSALRWLEMAESSRSDSVIEGMKELREEIEKSINR